METKPSFLTYIGGSNIGLTGIEIKTGGEKDSREELMYGIFIIAGLVRTRCLMDLILRNMYEVL